MKKSELRQIIKEEMLKEDLKSTKLTNGINELTIIIRQQKAQGLITPLLASELFQYLDKIYKSLKGTK